MLFQEDDVLKIIKDRIIGKASITGTFER